MSLEPREFSNNPQGWKQVEKGGKIRDAPTGKKKSNFNPNAHRPQKRDPLEGAVSKFNALTLHGDTDPDLSQRKKSETQDMKKKKKAPQEPPPPPRPRFEELLPSIKAKELSSYIERQSKKFDSEVWLRDVVRFLQSHLEADPKQYGPLMDPQDSLFPFSALSNEIRQILLQALENQSDRVLEFLFIQCIREELIPALNKDTPTYGVRIMLKAICVQRYHPVVSYCKKIPELIRSYASNNKICLSILWAVYNINTLLPTFSLWIDAMFPVLLGQAARDVHRCVWNSLSNLLAYHKSIGTEIPRQIVKPYEHTDILIAFAKLHDNNASDEIKHEFSRVCKLLQFYVYQYEPQNTLRGHFNNLLLHLNSKGSTFLHNQYIHCLYACITCDSHCTKLWCRDILSKLKATNLLLRYMVDMKEQTVDALNKINIKKEGVKQSNSSLNLFSGLREELTNELNPLFAENHASEEYRQTLDMLLIMEKESTKIRVVEQVKKVSWFRRVFWFSFIFFLSALFVDIATHETIRVTFFGRFLDDVGILPVIIIAQDTFAKRFPQVIEFLGVAREWSGVQLAISWREIKLFMEYTLPRLMNLLLNTLVGFSSFILSYVHPVLVYLAAKFEIFSLWFYSNIFLSNFVQHTLNDVLKSIDTYIHTSRS
ncbi:hypothetical protein LOD99_16257 [Oopsacas minuta]|uniref:Transmembrane protein 214 n=1 Tax=Oopsacas minuta TaxID=111878 RepID=A0AAV7K7K0_9METZ|nr:hypothetical protein LOD99_16257 [Oopsacas minuta]